jgi:ABC-type phosphate transport system permease subunit
MWISGRFVPMLFALFVAAPVGVILPFFIPKFIRNANRRRKYEVELKTDPVWRIPGEKRSYD